MRIALVTPPLTQLNTPYPATAVLTAWLRRERPEDVVTQWDLSLELALRWLSPKGLEEVATALLKKRVLPLGLTRGLRRGLSDEAREAVTCFLSQHKRASEIVLSVVGFLQGKHPTLAHRLADPAFYTESAVYPRHARLFDSETEEDLLYSAFGALGVTDRAKYLASLWIDDLADVLKVLDPRFGLSRYAERLGANQASFDPLLKALSETTLVDTWIDELSETFFARANPDVVGFTAPFPGNVYGAFRIAQRLKTLAARSGRRLTCVLGGGYVNTELRSLSDARVFDFMDAVILDDGEAPLRAFLAALDRSAIEPSSAKQTDAPLLRTAMRAGDKVVWTSAPSLHDVPSRALPTPTYDGLELSNYLSLLELLNPMHRLWSDGRWNKLTLAHGCYWKKCSFCDVSLDYIGRYDPLGADAVVDRIEALIAETGERGFHFTDEAAPPALLKAMAERLLARGIVITWWANIRFEKAFTPEVCALLVRSGCIAVSGGLEVASDRLLKLMNKGVDVAQVARVTRAFSDAGILVHAYLMYGFPSETVQETVESLERVRQLFSEGCIQSAFWHRFSATIHSPVGQNPKAYGLRVKRIRGKKRERLFSENDLPFIDPSGCSEQELEVLGAGLKLALQNYMQGRGFELDVREWFKIKAPVVKTLRRLKKPNVSRDLVAQALISSSPRASL